MMRLTVALGFSMILAACGGGGGGGSSVSAAPQSTDATGQPPGSNATGTTTTGNTSLPAATVPNANALYERAPIVTSCDAGALRASEKTAVLAKLNAVRALHGLPAVVYDPQSDIETAKSALISVANAKLDHTPALDDKCYTKEGSDGSGASNLYIRFSSGTGSVASDFSVTAFLIDDKVPSLGHRRWLLHPFLSATSFGRVDGAPLVTSTWPNITGMSLKVIGSPAADLSASTLEYVAYPHNNYPAEYFKHGWFMSFSVLASKTNSNANGKSAADFTSATLEVLDPNGAALTLSERSANYSGFGLANSLQWRAAGTQDNVQYTVRIGNVKVNGANKTFQYTFRIVP